jgi:HK97 family phage prohead protease
MPSMQNAEIQYKASAGTFNLDEAQGIVECFVAGIGNKDSVGDVCATGAFAKSLLRRKPRVVWGHNWNDPIGKVLDIYEVPASDPRLPMKMKMAGIGGLYAKVQFNLQSEKGREAFANVAFFGEEQEWSIGYKTLRAQYDQNMQANILYEVELYEVSPVLHGANQLTGTISVKNDSGKSDTIERAVFASGPMQEAVNVTPIASRENNTEDDLLQKISSELEKRTASKIKIVSLDKNSVVFDRQTSDGLVSKYMCKYHYDGQELMFGQPQRIVIQKPNINPSIVPSQQGKPTMHGRVTKPVPVMPMPVAIRPGENGPISIPLPVVVYEDSSKNKPTTPKPLDNEEQALADALVRITKKYGKFNEDKKGVYAAYTPAAENELINIGVKCSNCIFFKGEGSCKIIDKAVEADGRCRFAVIPPGVVGGSAIDKKEYNDFLDEEEVKWVEDIEEKYPGEFVFGVLRGVVKRRNKKRKKYKELNEFDAEEYAIKEKTLASGKEKFFYIPVDVENAFEVKSLLDAVLDHHRVDSFVDEYGIVLTSGLTAESVDAINIAVKGIGTRIGKRIGSGLINRPRIGDRRRRLGGGRIDIPTGGMRGTKRPTGNRRDVDADGWADEGTTNPVWVGLPSGADKKPTPSGAGKPKKRTPIWEQNRRPSPPVPSRLRELSDDKKPESRRTPPPAPPKPKPTKTPSSPPPPPRKKEKLSSGTKDITRHRSAKKLKNPAEDAKETDFEKIANSWREQGLGWVEIPRYPADKKLSNDFLRGRELGYNQVRVMWNGSGTYKRPANFNEKAKSSVEYRTWFLNTAKTAGEYIKNSRKSSNTSEAEKEINFGIPEGIENFLDAVKPNVSGLSMNDRKEFFGALIQYRLVPERDIFGGDYGLRGAYVYPKAIEPKPSKKLSSGRKVPFPEAKPKRTSKQQRDDEKIYKRRNDGESLADVAESLGLSREEVRKREQRHMRRLRKEEGERLSEDSNRSGETLSSGRREYEDKSKTSVKNMPADVRAFLNQQIESQRKINKNSDVAKLYEKLRDGFELDAKERDFIIDFLDRIEKLSTQDSRVYTPGQRASARRLNALLNKDNPNFRAPKGTELRDLDVPLRMGEGGKLSSGLKKPRTFREMMTESDRLRAQGIMSDSSLFDDEWQKTEYGIRINAPDIDGSYEIQGNAKDGFVVSRIADAVRNGGQEAKEYEHDKVFKSRAAAKKWAARDYKLISQEVGLSSGRKKKGKIAKRRPFSPEDRQRFADGDRLKARTIPSKKKPGPSIDEFRLSSGYGGGSRPARRLAQLNRREVEQIYIQESRGMEEQAKNLLANLKTPSFDESLEKGSKLETIRGNLKKAFTTPALVGSLSDNKNRKKDGPWMLSFEKLRPLLRDSKGEPMSDENIKKMFNLNEDEMKKLLGKNGAISSASVQSYLTAHSDTNLPGESDGLIRKVWGFDSAPYWYDGLEDNKPVSREDYDAAKDESTFLAAIYPLDAPIDFKTSTEIDEDALPKKREIVVAEDVKRSIESVKGKESKEAYSLDKLIEKLNMPADSGKNREEIAKAFEKLLGVPTSTEQLFTSPGSWRRNGVPTNVILELKKRKHITSAADVFGSDEAKNFDKATEQNKFFSALDNLLRANGIQIGGGKGNLSDRVIGEIMGDAIGSKPLAKIGRAFKKAGEEKPFTYKVGAAVVWTPEEIQKTIDGINRVTGKDFKVSDLKLSSGKFGKGERKVTPKLSSGRTGAESFSANESINEIDERLRTAKKRGSKVFNEMLRAESKKQSSQKVKPNPLDKMKDGERLSSGKLDEVYKSITQKLIKAIETADGDKWEAPWYKVGAFPKNPTNKNRPYSNTNLLFLLMAQEDKGYTKPYWATYKQWEKSGGQVRAGEKGTKILVPRVYKAKEDDEDNKKGGGVFYSVATVFNVDQVDGVDVEEMENKFPKLSEEQRVSQLESAIKEIGAKITEAESDRAYYSPSKDEIVLPKFENFKSPLDFYATQAHELMHWTGHTSRLNRPNMNYFGSPEYAYEELVAEIASAFFMAAHGLSAEPQPQHAMYLASWLKRLKSDPDALQKAVSDAQKAVNFAIKLSPSMSKQMAVSENVDDVPGITVPDTGGKLSSGKTPDLPALTRALENAGLAESVTENMITEAINVWKDNPSLHRQYIERLDGDVNGAVFSLYNDYLEDMFDRSPEGAAKIERELDEQYEATQSLSSGRPSKRLSRRLKDDESSKLSSGKQPWDDPAVQKRLIDGARTKKKTKADGKTESYMASMVRQFDAGKKLTDNQWKPLWESFGGETSATKPSTPSTASTSKALKPFSGLKRKEIDLSDVKKYDYPTTDAKGKKKPLPTEEQSDAIDAMMTGSDVKVAALAATGKTTTVINFANRLLDEEPESRILYLVFNKNAERDVVKRGMPENVTVRTMDAVAFRAMKTIDSKMTDKSFNPSIKPIKSFRDRAAYLGVKRMVSQGDELTSADVVKRIAKAVEHFSISSDTEIGPQHFNGKFNGKLAVDDDAILPELVALANKYWKDIKTPRDGVAGMLPVNNTHITKMWALSKPDIGSSMDVNIAMVDEAQDMNPVFAEILQKANKVQRIYIGDTNQAINAWRGADGQTLVDAPAKYTMPITDSFRFGKNIAGIGNRFLSLLGAKEKMTGRKVDKSGNPVDGFIGNVENPTMILTRSNGGAMAATMKSFEKGLTVYGSKNFKEDLTKFIDNVEYMETSANGKKGYYTSADGRKIYERPSMSQDLDGISNIEEFKEAVEKGDDNRLNMLNKLLSEHGVEELRNALGRIITDEKKLPKNRDEYVHIQTAHTSKGLESPRVQIWSDFAKPKKATDGTNITIMPNEQELRLSYVAVTRAEEKLDLGSLSWIYNHTSDEDGASNKLSSGANLLMPRLSGTLSNAIINSTPAARKMRKEWKKRESMSGHPSKRKGIKLSSGRYLNFERILSSDELDDNLEPIRGPYGDPYDSIHRKQVRYAVRRFKHTESVPVRQRSTGFPTGRMVERTRTYFWIEDMKTNQTPVWASGIFYYRNHLIGRLQSHLNSLSEDEKAALVKEYEKSAKTFTRRTKDELKIPS